jgi:hypothetical protein
MKGRENMKRTEAVGVCENGAEFHLENKVVKFMEKIRIRFPNICDAMIFASGIPYLKLRLRNIIVENFTIIAIVTCEVPKDNIEILRNALDRYNQSVSSSCWGIEDLG